MKHAAAVPSFHARAHRHPPGVMLEDELRNFALEAAGAPFGVDDEMRRVTVVAARPPGHAATGTGGQRQSRRPSISREKGPVGRWRASCSNGDRRLAMRDDLRGGSKR